MASATLFIQPFRYKESNGTIIADDERTVKTAISSIKHHRNLLENYIVNNPRFRYSLNPLLVNEGPLVVRLMADAAEKANVGPMAAVAGVLADLAVKDMIGNGSDVAIVENGGEISAMSNRPINVALLAGDSSLSGSIGFRLTDFPIGVATSSGTFSHALSFGEADAVTIFAANAGIADAAATAVGNLIKGKNWRRSIKRGIRKALSIPEVEGALIVVKESVGSGGQIPQMIKVRTAKNTSFFIEAQKSLGNFVVSNVLSQFFLNGDCLFFSKIFYGRNEVLMKKA